jgi:hypothetical protein
VSLRLLAIGGPFLLAFTAGCFGQSEPVSGETDDNDLFPGATVLFDDVLPPGHPGPALPALQLWPSKRELHVSGWTEDKESRRVEQLIPIPQGRPLTMCWRPTAELAVAILADTGETIILGWTWDGEGLHPTSETALFEGQAGLVIEMVSDPRTGSLVLLDGRNGRLLEVMGPNEIRTLADTTAIPVLLGQRSLMITMDHPGGEAATFTLTTIPHDVHTIDLSDGMLQIRDFDPWDGQIDEWVLQMP